MVVTEKAVEDCHVIREKFEALIRDSLSLR